MWRKTRIDQSHNQRLAIPKILPHRAACLGLAVLTEVSKERCMTPEKKTDHAPKPSAPAAEGGRKPWTPKTPVEVVLEQISRQERKVSELQAELDAEKSMLTKLLQAKRVLEST
jgi:hypothetical protein